MLVLTRREHERIQIGDDIMIEVVLIAPGKVRLGILAPVDIPIARTELLEHGPFRSRQTREGVAKS